MKFSIQRVAAYYDMMARGYDTWRDTPADLWRKISTQTVLDRAEVDSSDVVMDLGCGTGEIARLLGPHVKQFIGVDCSQGMLKIAKAKETQNVRWLRADMREPPEVPGLTTVIMNHAARYLTATERAALWRRLHGDLPEDGMIILGDRLWTLDPEIVEGAEAMVDPYADTVMAEDVMEELRAARFYPRMVVLHPSTSVITAIKP